MTDLEDAPLSSQRWDFVYNYIIRAFVSTCLTGAGDYARAWDAATVDEKPEALPYRPLIGETCDKWLADIG
jgi:hypothetical protein